MAAKGGKTPAANALEWGLGALSALVVLAITGYLVREGLSETEEPVISVEAGDAADGVLPVTVRNDGGRTATSVAISLTVGGNGIPVEERYIVIDYVPGHSEAVGAFVLPEADPGLEPRVTVEGYVLP